MVNPNIDLYCIDNKFKCFTSRKQIPSKHPEHDLYKVSDSQKQSVCKNPDNMAKLCLTDSTMQKLKKIPSDNTYYFKLTKDKDGNITKITVSKIQKEGFTKIKNFYEELLYIKTIQPLIKNKEQVSKLATYEVDIPKDYFLQKCPTKDCNDLTVLDKYPKEVAGGTGLITILSSCCTCIIIILLIIMISS